MAEIALRYSDDPLAKLESAADRFDTDLTPQNLQKITGWNSDKIREVFTHSTLEEIALSPRKPATEVRRIAQSADREDEDITDRAADENAR
jgi:hypothetical protein